MTSFQEFRYWLRRAPSSDRAAAAVAAVVVLALAAWLLVPLGSSKGGTQDVVAPSGGSGLGQPGSTTGTTGAGQSGTGTTGGQVGVTTGPLPAGTTGGSTGVTSGSPSGGTTGAPAGTSGGTRPGSTTGATTIAASCPQAASGAAGLTASTVKIAVMLTEIYGPIANGAVGIPSADDQKVAFKAVIDAQNASGGAACRKIVPQFFTANPADQSDLQAKCLDAVAAKVFAVVDTGAWALYGPDCFAQHKLPYFSGFLLRHQTQAANYPYLFAFFEIEDLYRATVTELTKKGFFSASTGFKKLGYLYSTCSAETIPFYKNLLSRAGVPDSAVVTYDLGCPSADNPADDQQAVLKFQREGVTHVTMSSYSFAWANFTKFAQQQGFKPKYGLPDEITIGTSYGTQRPDPDNLDGAIMITTTRSGEERTPGAARSAGTKKCDAVYAKKGLPPTWKQPFFYGNTCDQVWMLAAAMQNAPVLAATTLAEGLQRSKSIDFSYPQGPTDFTGSRVTTGGQFYRGTQFYRTCACWRVVAPQFTRVPR